MTNTNLSSGCGCNCNNKKLLRIPARGPIEALEALGASSVERNIDTVGLQVPDGWSIQPTSVSQFHQHLVDADGSPLACLFIKPGSGGTGSFQLSSKDNCAELAAN